MQFYTTHTFCDLSMTIHKSLSQIPQLLGVSLILATFDGFKRTQTNIFTIILIILQYFHLIFRLVTTD